jgi:hypothetical protein
MNRLILIMMCLLISVSMVNAAEGPKPVSGQVIILTAASNGVTRFTLPANIDDITTLRVCTEGNTLRWRDDGTLPTADLGPTLDTGDCIYLRSRKQINNFNFIGNTGLTGITVYGTWFIQ